MKRSIAKSPIKSPPIVADKSIKTDLDKMMTRIDTLTKQYEDQQAHCDNCCKYDADPRACNCMEDLRASSLLGDIYMVTQCMVEIKNLNLFPFGLFLDNMNTVTQKLGKASVEYNQGNIKYIRWNYIEVNAYWQLIRKELGNVRTNNKEFEQKLQTTINNLGFVNEIQRPNDGATGSSNLFNCW